MGKFNISQNSFSFGELSPMVKGRNDLKEYAQGLEKLENMTVRNAGGVSKRPGFVYQLDSPASGGSRSAILPFNPDDATGYYIVIESALGMPSATTPAVYKIDNTPCVLTLDEDSTYDLSIPDGLINDGWRFVQSSDVLFVTHNSGAVEPFIIYRTGDTAFTMTPYAKATGILGVDSKYALPFKDINLTSDALGITGTELIAPGGMFTTSDIGRHAAVVSGGVTHVVRITAYTSTTHVTVSRLNGTGDIAGVTTWYMGAWGGSAGYPTNVIMHEQRLCWMATNSTSVSPVGDAPEPNKIWASATGNLFKMTRITTDSADYTAADAFNFAIGGGKPNRISWVSAGSSLKVGTIGEEYIVNFVALDDGSISYATADIQTSHGGAAVMPAMAGYSTLFISRNRREVRQFKYNDSNGSFISVNLNVLADHLFDYPIKKMVWQESERVLWVLTDDSTSLISLTFDTDSNITAWSRHPLGVIGDSVTTYLAINDICVVYNGEDDELVALIDNNILLISSKPTIMKKAKRFDTIFDKMVGDTYSTRPYFVDHAIRSYEATATVTHGGFVALAETTVALLVDGIYIGDTLVPTTGEIVLDDAANEVIAGYKYNALIKTMPIDAGGTLGDSAATVKRVDEANVRFHRTISASVGDMYTDAINEMEEQDFENDGTFYSGIKTVKMPNGYDIDGDYSIVIEDESPSPMTILAITYKGQSGN